jgi:ActR/RegA family two-component response regulator
MTDARELTASDLTITTRAALSSIAHLITDAVMSMYSASGQNTARTAQELGLARRTVHRLVRANQARRKA